MLALLVGNMPISGQPVTAFQQHLPFAIGGFGPPLYLSGCQLTAHWWLAFRKRPFQLLAYNF